MLLLIIIIVLMYYTIYTNNIYYHVDNSPTQLCLVSIKGITNIKSWWKKRSDVFEWHSVWLSDKQALL